MKSAPILLLIVFTGILAIFQQSTNAMESPVPYGAQCNTTFTCDESKSLSCLNGTCQCILPETMIYEPQVSSCLVLPQESCVVADASAGDSTNASGPAQERQLLCVNNAMCDSTLKICLCEEIFFELNGTCKPKGVFNETCFFGREECREDLGLFCSLNDVCDCEPSRTIYSKTNGCVGQAGKPCISGMCADNARCANIAAMEEAVLEASGINNDGGYDATNDSASAIMACVCFDGYALTPSGSCAKDYGIFCNERQTCKSWLKCGEAGYCECVDPTTQVYDENAAMCVSKVGGPCGTNFTLDQDHAQENVICIAGAECVSGNAENEQGSSLMTSNNHCRCKEGFEENGQGGCELAFGSRCKNDDGTDSIMPCNRKSNLECGVGGTCECMPHYQYDKDEKACVGRVGANCTIVQTVITSSVMISVNELGQINSRNGGRTGCIRGARCEELKKEKEITYQENQELIQGVCKCVDEEVGCDGLETPQVEYIIAAAGAIFGMAVVGTLCYAFFTRQKRFADALNDGI